MYGKIIPHLILHGQPAEYPVVNEREIRGAAGMMFAIGLTAFVYVMLTKDFRPMYVVVPVFWLDFFLKSIFQPQYSIFGSITRLIIRGQVPEYVGAIQKRFAWSIGLLMASIMMIGPVLMGIRGLLPQIICSMCIFFMWMESSFGICVGCKVYGLLLKLGVLPEPNIRPACPGGACSIQRVES